MYGRSMALSTRSCPLTAGDRTFHTSHVTAPAGGDTFNVKKEGRAEPDLWVRLSRLEF